MPLERDTTTPSDEPLGPAPALDSGDARDTSGAAEGEAGPPRRRLLGAAPWVVGALGLLVAVKLVVFVFGAIVADGAGASIGSVADALAVWNRWDAPNYLFLAEHGYVTTGRESLYIVFLPGYPAAVRIVHDLLPGSYLSAAFVVSTLASAATVLLLAALVRRDTRGEDDPADGTGDGGGDDAQAMRAVLFLLVFPTAYFLHIPYTESLFLALVLGAFLAARNGHWATAGIVGALAAFTRVNGLLLLPALVVEAYLQYRRTGRVERSWAWIGLVGAGTLAYLAINAHVYGDPFHFQVAQESNWHKSLADPITSVKNLVGFAGSQASATDSVMFGWSELLFLAVGLATAIAAFVWTRASYGVWALLNVLLIASTSFIQSTPRYAITLFPIFLLLARVRRPWAVALVSVASVAAMAYLSRRFALGSWAY